MNESGVAKASPRIERGFALLLLFCTLPLLFFPKVNLIHFSGETAGLRLDDCILFLVAFPLFWAVHAASLGGFAPERRILLWTGICLLSFFLNHLFVSLGIFPFSSHILYCFRLLEYFLFFYVGLLYAQFFSVTPLLLLFLGLNMGVALLQKGGFVGGMTVEGYLGNVSERVVGITSFPNELALTLNLLLCFLAFRSSFPLIGILFLFGTTTCLIIWTGSRIALCANLIAVMGIFWTRPAARIWSLLLAPIFFILIGWALIGSEGLLGRSGGLLRLGDNLQVLKDVWIETDPLTIDWEAPLMLKEVDASWWLRLHKWCHALKLYVTHPQVYLTGVGPGFATAALDGGLLRVLVETGLIGLFIFFTLLSSLAKESRSLKWMCAMLLINMIFIDAHLSYKAMSLFFFLSGCVFSHVHKREFTASGKYSMMSEAIMQGEVSSSAAFSPATP